MAKARKSRKSAPKRIRTAKLKGRTVKRATARSTKSRRRKAGKENSISGLLGAVLETGNIRRRLAGRNTFEDQ